MVYGRCRDMHQLLEGRPKIFFGRIRLGKPDQRSVQRHESFCQLLSGVTHKHPTIAGSREPLHRFLSTPFRHVVMHESGR